MAQLRREAPAGRSYYEPVDDEARKRGEPGERAWRESPGGMLALQAPADEQSGDAGRRRRRARARKRGGDDRLRRVRAAALPQRQPLRIGGISLELQIARGEIVGRRAPARERQRAPADRRMGAEIGERPAGGEADVDPFLGRQEAPLGVVDLSAGVGQRSAERVDETPPGRPGGSVQAEQPAGTGLGAGRATRRCQEELSRRWQRCPFQFGEGRFERRHVERGVGSLAPRRFGAGVDEQSQERGRRRGAGSRQVVAVDVHAVVAGRQRRQVEPARPEDLRRRVEGVAPGAHPEALARGRGQRLLQPDEERDQSRRASDGRPLEPRRSVGAQGQDGVQIALGLAGEGLPEGAAAAQIASLEGRLGIFDETRVAVAAERHQPVAQMAGGRRSDQRRRQVGLEKSVVDEREQQLVELVGLGRRLARLVVRRAFADRRPGRPDGRRLEDSAEACVEVGDAGLIEGLPGADPAHLRCADRDRGRGPQPDPLANRRIVEQRAGEGVDARPARREVRRRRAGGHLGLRPQLPQTDTGQKAARRGAKGCPPRVARERPIPRRPGRGARQRRAGDGDRRRAERMRRQLLRGARKRGRGKQRRPEQEPRQRCVHGGEINPPGSISCTGSPRGGDRWPESAWGDGSGR